MADRIEEAAIRFQDPFLELLLNTGEDLRPEQRAEFVENLMAKQGNLNPIAWRAVIEYRDDLEARFDKQLKRYMGPLTSEQTTHIERGGANDAPGPILAGGSPRVDRSAS